MTLKIFAVRDTKTEAYMQPFFMNTRGQAIRAFSDEVANEKSQFSKHPEDYILFEIGAYDDSNGTLIPSEPTSLGCAIDFVRAN